MYGWSNTRERNDFLHSLLDGRNPSPSLSLVPEVVVLPPYADTFTLSPSLPSQRTTIIIII